MEYSALPFYSLNSLIVFYAVVRSKSFSKAASILSRTQPGISNHVAELELQVGRALLKRERGKFELTKEGKIIFRYANKIVKASKELEDAIRSIQTVERCLRVGSTPTYSRILMPSIISSFQKAYPSVKIKLDVGGSEEMEQTLLSMQNDAVIIANPRRSSKVHAQFLFKEELVLIASKQHGRPKEDCIPFAALRDYPLILRSEGSATRRVVLSALAAINVTPSTLIEVKNVDVICGLVSQGLGLSIVTKTAAINAKKDLSIITFCDPPFLEMYVLSLKSRKYDVWLQRFLDHILQVNSPTPFPG